MINASWSTTQLQKDLRDMFEDHGVFVELRDTSQVMLVTVKRMDRVKAEVYAVELPFSLLPFATASQSDVFASVSPVVAQEIAAGLPPSGADNTYVRRPVR